MHEVLFALHASLPAFKSDPDFFDFSEQSFLQAVPALPFGHPFRQPRKSNLGGRFLEQAVLSAVHLFRQVSGSKPALSTHSEVVLQLDLHFSSDVLNCMRDNLFAWLPTHILLQSKQSVQAFLKLSASAESEFCASRQTSDLEQFSAHASTSHAFSGSYFTPALHVAALSFFPLPPLPPTLAFPAPFRPRLLRLGKVGFTKSQAGKSSNSSSISNW
mmetsp:Transcript_60135/g.95514  ORF Transcript_60135/g.95514 Transcript_60135/m.95514 type:complete len:216 (-) Transcript_60135:1216-1863(-)